MGEHADFAGVLDTKATRFDVTTNLDFKKFDDYEPYMGQGPIYKIALMDKKSFDVIDIIDLAFPTCSCCGGYLISTIVLLDQNYNRHGESLWNNDQLLIDICTDCQNYIEKQRYTHEWLYSINEYNDSALDDDDSIKKILCTRQK